MSQAVGIQDHPKYKLGAVVGPDAIDKRTVKLADFLNTDIQAPPTYDFDKGRKPFPVHVWGNNAYGDCEIAGRCNYMLRLQRAQTKTTPGIDDNDAIAAYKALTGCQNPGDANDVGMSTVTNLNAWMGGWKITKDWQMGGEETRDYTLSAYGYIDPANEALTRLATYLFNGTLWGVALPITAQAQTDQGVWDVEGDPNDENGPAYPGSWGGHCLAPETLVLTSDLKWVALGDLEVGDKLISFDEWPIQRTRRWKGSEIEKIETIKLPCYELVFEDGTTIIASTKHQWLVSMSSGNCWQQTKNLVPGIRIFSPVDTWQYDSSREAGYLSASFDGEGCLSNHKSIIDRAPSLHRLDFYQNENEMLREVEGSLLSKNYNVSRQVATPGVAGTSGVRLAIHGRNDLMRFLGSVRPPRLLSKFNPDSLGQFGGRGGGSLKLEEMRFIGNHEVVAMQTDARTYVAEGLASHNCVYAKKYDADNMYFLTWGMEIRATNRWVQTYSMEEYSVIDSLDPWFNFPQVLDVAKMISEMKAAGINVQQTA